MMQMQPTIISSILLFALLLLPAPSTSLPSSDCSSCDHSLTAPVYYGCTGDSAYVTFDSVKIDCGAALSLNHTSSIPRFYYPDADAEAIYTLLMMDTTGIDPIVGTQPPFLPFPIIHYGAMNIPGDVLIDGMSLDKFHYDATGIRVQPFLSYVDPKPSEELSKVQPDYVPPDLNTRAFNYEFILGEQSRERDVPLMDKNTNWEFIGFLKRSIGGLGDPVASTYFSTGYCVKDIIEEGSSDSLVIEEEEGAIGSDCPVPSETLSGVGSVPAHVAGVGGYWPPAGSNSGPNGSDDGGSGIGTTQPGGDPAGSGNGDSPDGTDSGDSTGGSDDDVNSSRSAFGNRSSSAAVISCVVGLMYGIICV